MKKFVLAIILVSTFLQFSKADEGMWIPLLIEKLNIQDMQEKGFKLSADDIYSINQACIKDAIVLFGRGCTGELVSDKGLLLTNFHCGRGAIQGLSSLENNYLETGFWSQSMDEELPAPGLTVKFLKQIEDVTEKVLQDVTENLSDIKRDSIINANIILLEQDAVKDNNFIASIKPFFYGNQYYLFIYEEFKDVRLVGNPPASIGNFGSDTDNWVWPRHTGDFSVFRIYADKENKPAEYSPDNVPYKPKKSLSISIKGLNEGDFTWVIGYPGSTKKYITSDAIRLVQDVINPLNYNLRDKRIEIIESYETNNDTIKLKYGAKKYGISNSWKRWDGEIKGLKRLNAVEKKLILENEFTNWAINNNKNEYQSVITDLSKIYSEIEKYLIAYELWWEAVRANEMLSFSYRFKSLVEAVENNSDEELISLEIKKLKKLTDYFFKDYAVEIDQEIFNFLIPEYFKTVNKEFYPIISDFDLKEFEQYSDDLYNQTIFNKKNEIHQLLDSITKDNVSVISGDPAYKFYSEFANIFYNKVKPKYDSLNAETNKLYRLYLKGLQEMKINEKLFPDANMTMRVSYGNVKGYSPKDAVEFKYFTTLDGVIEKEDPKVFDYEIPEKLKDLYAKKDFGLYEENGTVPVCFIATNHTTGGNSGSPVLDAEGNLIGLNFDRAWEGIMSDMMFDPLKSRNISVDIRYVLFIIDKYAGATHLIDEMNIIK